MLPAFSRFVLKLLGWRTFDVSGRPVRAVLIEYPHTSNWDAIYGLLTSFAIGAGVSWMAKDTAFRWPFAGLLKRLGGIPVNRRERTNSVAQMIGEFATRERFVLGITPEGTRSLTPGWKSGFYRIAIGAGVPVLLSTIDYARKEAGIIACLELSGDPDRDLARIAEIYAGRRGRRPALASPIRWLPDTQFDRKSPPPC
jgi:1-acyl-sn-glycerol-3-phosphate acyltransferase